MQKNLSGLQDRYWTRSGIISGTGGGIPYPCGSDPGTLSVTRIIVSGSYVRGELHEGSDIDLVVVGDISGRFHERGTFIRVLTDLLVETLCYSPHEFDEMVRTGNTLIQTVLAEGRDR